MPRKWYEAPVIQLEDLNKTTKKIVIALDDTASFSFIAGQFVTMDLPLGDKRNQRWRSYSIAHANYDGRLLEFCVVRMEDGLASNYFFNQLQIGDFIKFKGPEGGFIIPEFIDHDMIMVCTGTGIAPFRAMLWDIVIHNRDHQNIHLIFGTRDRNGILFEEELKYFKSVIPGFKYSIVLSREKADEYSFGYVHQVYLNEYGKPVANRKFYLCGWTQMVDEAVEHLIKDLHYDAPQIKYELYG